MKKEHTVSLCMIVYNEESSLPSCLESVRQLVDEIIIVDTGSTDKTLSIAKEAGARLFSFQWQENFSLARNFSLLNATGDWILVLDADEILEPCSRHQFDELFTHDNIEGYFFPVRNVLQGDNQETLDHVVRLFRHRPEFQFEGALHEQILPSILRFGGEKSLAHAPFSIRHFGYLPQKIKEKNKFDRNRQILTQELANNPSNPFYLYCLGLEYLQQNEFASGISYLEAALEQISLEEGYYPDLLLSLALSYLKTEKLPQLFTILDQGLKTLEKERDFFILYGIGHLLAQEPLKALERLKQALELQNTPAGIFTCSQIYSLLGDSYAQANLSHAATNAYLEALKVSPQFLYPFLQILDLLRRTYTPEELAIKKDLLSQISSFAPPNLQADMSVKLIEQGNLPLAALMRLCASISTLSVSSDGLLDIPRLYQEIISCINILNSNKVTPVLTKSLDLVRRELDVHQLFIRQFPDERLLLNRLPFLLFELFTLITFHYLSPTAPLIPSRDLIPNVGFPMQKGG